MSIILVKNTTTYEAIQATDENAQETVNRWFHAANPEAPHDLQVDLAPSVEQQLWFVKHPTGQIMLVPNSDFLKDFEELDAETEFLQMLADAPEAPEGD